MLYEGFVLYKFLKKLVFLNGMIEWNISYVASKFVRNKT